MARGIRKLQPLSQPINEPSVTKKTESHTVESALLDLWRTIQASHYDLGILPPGFAAHPILQKPSLTRLLAIAGNQSPNAMSTALTHILSITTHNQGIALQMWWTQVAWLKRRLAGCVEFDWKATDITRRAIALEELLAHFQIRSLNPPPAAQ